VRELAQILRISFLMRPSSHAGPRWRLSHSHADHPACVTRRNVVKIATLMLSSVLALGLVAGPAAAAQAGSRSSTESGPANCALKTYTVTAVAPQFTDVQQGRVTTRRLAGAVVSVQAQPGLTAEWLTLSLERHLSSMQAGVGMKDCPLTDVRVGVGSAGAGFAIQLTAKDPKSAQEVLRRARLLRG